MFKRVLVTGATGKLGSVLVPTLRRAGIEVVTQGLSSLADVSADLTIESDAHAVIGSVRPDAIVNLVALTSVDDCEENLHKAYLLNTKSVENLVTAIDEKRVPAHLVHISTDHLYDGPGRHVESEVRISNNYAMTKYAGELAALRTSCTVLRTNFIGKSLAEGREGLTDWVYRTMRSGEAVNVLSDVYFNPVSMATLSEMIVLVLERLPMGVYNLGARGMMSKADLDFAFAEAAGLPTRFMTRIELSGANFLRAYRPKNMVMDCTKFERALGITLPTLEDEINSVAKEYV